MTASRSSAGKETERTPAADFGALSKKPAVLQLGLTAPHGDGQPLQVDIPSPQGRQLPEPQGGESRQEHEQPVARRDGVGDGEDLRHRETGRSGTP